MGAIILHVKHEHMFGTSSENIHTARKETIMTHNEISLMLSIEKKALYGTEIDRIEQKMLSVGTESPLFEYLCNEMKYFKEKLARESRFCEYLVNEISKESKQ